MDIDEDVIQTYKVVINHEEQYSIWPAERENAPGWQDAGPVGSKKECLDYIEEHWTDMRPKSLRDAMATNGSAADRRESAPAESLEPSLVERLSQGQHPVAASVGPDGGIDRLRTGIDERHVQLRFTGTRGETEIGIELSDETDLRSADFDARTGRVHLVGELVLDFVKVRCIADIALESLSGEGRLEIL